jgi:hypothetical protein
LQRNSTTNQSFRKAINKGKFSASGNKGIAGRRIGKAFSKGKQPASESSKKFAQEKNNSQDRRRREQCIKLRRISDSQGKQATKES